MPVIKQKIEEIESFYNQFLNSRTIDETKSHNKIVKTAALALYEHIQAKKTKIDNLLTEIQARLQQIYSADDTEHIKAHLPVAKHFADELEDELKHL